MKAITGILGKAAPILKIVGRVMQSIMLISIFAMNLLMAYIMFAPDDLPKPFYLSYAGQGSTTVILQPSSGVTTGGSEATASSSSEGGHTTTSEGSGSSETGGGLMFDTGSKIVNLADPGGRKYLRASVVLEIMPPAEVKAALEATPKAGGGEGEGGATVSPLVTEFNDEVNAKLPVINDTITSVLSSKTFESIYTTEGKNALRDEIKQQLATQLPEFDFIAVYFTEFVVQ